MTLKGWIMVAVAGILGLLMAGWSPLDPISVYQEKWTAILWYANNRPIVIVLIFIPAIPVIMVILMLHFQGESAFTMEKREK